MALLALSTVERAAAQIRLPRFFADGMVLQRETDIPLWGWATPSARLTVSLNGAEVTTTVRSDGTWNVMLPAQKAGGPYELTVSGDGLLTLHDVLVGDVFLCSGQSNMELPINRCMDVVRDQVTTYTNPNIRYLKFPHQFNYIRPNDDVQTLGWTSVSPETCGPIGALCYFIGRNLQEAEQVPIGIINSSVGGTRVECWMDRQTLATFPLYTQELQARKYVQEDWVDSVRREEALRADQWEQQSIQRDTIGHRCLQADFDFSAWQQVNIFDNFSNFSNTPTPFPLGEGRGEASGGPGRIHGIYWFHKSLTVSDKLAGQSALLRLGAMKDADSVFVNGHFVGNTTYEYPPRIYKIPADVLRAGTNHIVVKLMAQNGTPNFTQGKLYQLEVGDQVLPIDDQWQMARGSVMPPKPSATYFVDTPTGLYNAMIAPLRNFPFRAAVWYQGESNIGNAQHYADLLQAMVRCWRKQFRTDLPIVIVQLAGYMQRHDTPLQQSSWCTIREGQRQAAEALPHAALATAVDLGEWNDIHPQRKDELGRRVALQLRRIAYGEDKLVAEGPRPVSIKKKNRQIVIRFDRHTGPLRPVRLSSGPKPSTHLEAFAVAGQDGQFVWAKAHTKGAYTVIVDIPQGIDARRLRYAWDDYPVLSLYNEDGLPTGTFEIHCK